MKKILLNVIFITLIIIPLKISAISTSDAKEAIDTSKESSLTLKYNYEDYNFDNTPVKIYYIASITSDYQYKISKDFLKYQIKINGIKEEEWNILEQTLNSYIDADNIEELYKYSITNNKIEISNLKPGL